MGFHTSTFFCIPETNSRVKLNYHTKYHVLVKVGAAVERTIPSCVRRRRTHPNLAVARGLRLDAILL